MKTVVAYLRKARIALVYVNVSGCGFKRSGVATHILGCQIVFGELHCAL